MSSKIKIRRDTAANWTSVNPTLDSGELGFETDTRSLKIGDGATTWANLVYVTKSTEVIGKTITLANNTISGNISEFNAALTDYDFATLTKQETLTNKTIDAAVMTGNTNYHNGHLFSPTMVSPYGSGFTYMEVKASGSAVSWDVPTQLRVPGAKWKVTVIGGGAQGGGTTTTAGHVGGGGGSGGVVVGFYTYSTGQNTMTYSVGTGGSGAGSTANGNNGNPSNTIYNSITFSAGGGGGGLTSSFPGVGGSGGTATGGTLNIAGDSGESGGVMAATSNYAGGGGDTPLGYGFGGEMPGTAAGAAGNSGAGYGSGGSGGRNGTGTTSRAGGTGASGVIIIEY